MAKIATLLYTLLVSCICACLASFMPCSTDADCPAVTHFCDSQILRKCERCDYEVCRQSLPDWERACGLFCPDYLNQVIHRPTTQAPDIIVKDEQSKEAKGEATVARSPTLIAIIVVAVAGVCMAPAIAIFIIWKRKRRPAAVANDAPRDEMVVLNEIPNVSNTAAPRQEQQVDTGKLCP